MRVITLLLLLVFGAAVPHVVLAADRISVERAQQLIRAAVFRGSPQMNPQAQFPVREITPDAVWATMQTQVYQIVDGVQESCVYLIQRDRVYLAGPCFGGSGVTSMAVADLDSDGRAELYCASSWGSGISRSELSGFQQTDSGLRGIHSDRHQFWWVDLWLESEADTAVAIFTAIPEFRDGATHVDGVTFTRGQRLGDFCLAATDSGPTIELRVEKWPPLSPGGR